ncbi:hypothetical protein BC830DRAFT_1078219 [Chytriomyces sp. MP71]|nr:hypothetical protein BC830DRAFT_1078219 [Chytriomyces sp. MP71]
MSATMASAGTDAGGASGTGAVGVVRVPGFGPRSRTGLGATSGAGSETGLRPRVSETQVAAIGPWLVRLFEVFFPLLPLLLLTVDMRQSDFFDARLALHYMHLNPANQAIQAYICNAFTAFDQHDAEFWLPQILHLMVVRGGHDLENLVVRQALHSDHMAIMTLWQLQTYINQGSRLSSTNPDAAEQLQRVYMRTQHILFGRHNLASTTHNTLADPPASTSIVSSIPLLAESTTTIKPPSTAKLSLARPERTMSPESEGSSTGFYKVGAVAGGAIASGANADVGVDADADDEDSPSGSMSASFSSSAEGISSTMVGAGGAGESKGGSLVAVGAAGGVFDPMKESVIFVDRGISDRGTSAARTGQAFGLGSVAFEQSRASGVSGSVAFPGMTESKFFSFPLSAPTIEEMGQGRAFNRSIKYGSGASPSKAPNSKNNNNGSNKSGSDESNDSGRQSDVEWMLVSKPDYTYIDDPRMRYFHSQLQFMMTLSDISDRLRSVPKPARQNALFGELSLLNHNLPANVCIPMWCGGGAHDREHHWIVRVPPGDGVTLNSADRVPYLLIVEIVDCLEDDEPDEPDVNFNAEVQAHESIGDDMPIDPLTALSRSPDSDPINKLKRESTTGISSRASTSSLNTTPELGANSEENAEYYKSVLNRRNHLSPQSSTLPEDSGVEPLSPPPNSGANAPAKRERVVSHSRTASNASLAAASSAVDIYTQKMRTAAVMLAQLYQQQAAASGSPAGSAPGSPGNGRKGGSALGAGGGVAEGSAVGMPAGVGRVDFDAIRNKLVQEMTVLEEQRLKALEEQRAVEASIGISRVGSGSSSDGGLGAPVVATGSASGSDEAAPEGIDKYKIGLVKKDKDDPSAAVFKESWDAKCARIRAGSPFGHNPTWRMVSVIVKSGSDLRQEVLALQLIKEMERIWKEEKVPVWVHYYRVMVTSHQGGLIETIQNAISIHSIKKDGYSHNLNQPGVAYSLYDYFIQEFGAPASKRFLKAQDAFMRSLAGYSIICYLLQIKDRHNGNILIDKEGHSIHIDFGFMLSNSPGNMGFELAPFKLPQEFIDILGGTRSLKFKEYRSLCKDAFIAIRKRWDLIVGLVEIMEKDSVLPCFTGTSVKPSQTPATSSGSQPPTSSGGSLFGFLGSGSGSDSPASNTSSAQQPQSQSQTSGKPISVGSNLAYPVSMKLKERFSLGMTEAQVKDFVDRLVDSSTNSIMTKLYDAFQWYSNGVL